MQDSINEALRQERMIAHLNSIENCVNKLECNVEKIKSCIKEKIKEKEGQYKIFRSCTPPINYELDISYINGYLHALSFVEDLLDEFNDRG